MSGTMLTAAQTARIDAHIIREMSRQMVPGAAVGVYGRGRVLLAKGYGFADIGRRTPVGPKTIFQLGSVGKQFTAAAVMLLVEKGRMGLDDSITDYLDAAPKKWRGIRIKNLLSHTSGIADYIARRFTGNGGPFYMRLNLSERELARRAYRLPIRFGSGERWRYSNTNYMLLGLAIRRASGKPWFEYVKEAVFGRLGMKSPRLVHENDVVRDCASGYELRRGRVRDQEWWSDAFNSTADGVVYCNVLDMAKWDRALYGTRLLKRSSLNRMWTVFRLNDGKLNAENYGFARHMNRIGGHRVMEHSGSWQGFEAYIARYVDDGVTVVTMDNLARPAPLPTAHAIARIACPSLAAGKSIS